MDGYYVVKINSKGAHVDFNYFLDKVVDGNFRSLGNFYHTREKAQKDADKINGIFFKNRCGEKLEV